MIPGTATASNPRRVRGKPPIVSPLADLTTPFDLVETMGEDSKRFMTLGSLYSTAMTSLPSVLTDEISGMYRDVTKSYEVRYDSIAHSLKDLFRRIKVIRSLGEERAWLPFAELHRPKIEGCKATYTQSYASSADFSITVKVFGIGGGASKTRQYGFSDSTEIAGECVELVLPVTIQWEECRSGRRTFNRGHVKNIGRDYREVELTGGLDNCGIPSETAEKNNWHSEWFDIPQAVTRKKTLLLEAGQGAEFSLTTKILKAEVGPKAVVKHLKKTEFSYTLVGPHKYFAYLPNNRLAYYWHWK